VSYAFALFAFATPAIVLMAVWAGVTAFRILFPEDALPFDPAARRQRAAARGEMVPVRLRDILEDQEARRAVAAREAASAPDARPANPLVEDLWLRRN